MVMNIMASEKASYPGTVPNSPTKSRYRVVFAAHRKFLNGCNVPEATTDIRKLGARCGSVMAAYLILLCVSFLDNGRL